jgi:hypothetical protein
MPDTDVVQRNLARPWRSVYRLIRGQQPKEVIFKAVLQALASQLRLDGGAPALSVAAEAVVNATGSKDKSRLFSEVLRDVERRFSHRGTAKATAEAAQRLMTQIEAGRALPGLEPLAEEHCWRLIDRHLFGRLQRFVGGQHELPTFEELSDLRAECRRELGPEVRRLARHLATDPLAWNLRAPTYSLRMPTLSALLEEPL